jgi:hypothetical protein
MKFNHGVLRSLLNNQAMSWRVALTELIDNALDAHAKTITVTWSGRRFSVEDDGAGISPKGFEDIYTLGADVRPVHQKTIGRYGIGFKEAAGWLWGITRITSRHRGELRRLMIDWEAEAHRGLEQDDSAPIVTLTRRPTNDAAFTQILCREIRREMPYPDHFPSLVGHLEHVYRPALMAGAQIILQRGRETRTVAATPWPVAAPNTPAIDGTYTLAGRAVHVRAYVTAAEQREAGVHIAVLGRAMDCLTTKFQSRRVYGWATLGEEWEVSKNKTEISDPLRASLMQELEALCRPVLEAAERETQTVVLSELVLRVENELNDSIRGLMRLPTTDDGIELGPPPPPPPPPPGPIRPRRPRRPKPPGPPRPHDVEPDPHPAPRIGIKLVEMDPGFLTNVQKGTHSIVIEIDKAHVFTTAYLHERCRGALGMDPMRIVATAIHALAAKVAVDDEFLAMMPWLKDTAQADRYSLACARLWQGFLRHRVHGQELE